MIILISPAKTLDFDQPDRVQDATTIRFYDESKLLVDGLRHLAASDISDLMKVSTKIGELNFERFHNWQHPDNDTSSKQAVLAFKGDVYTGLDADSWDNNELNKAQSKLRILSGLYGLLRPLDKILPYRLEMGTKLTNERGKNLYEFWGNDITNALNSDLDEANAKFVVNLASNEYFKSIKPKLLNSPIVTPVFKDTKNGQLKIISFYAKKARGLMARWLIDNDIDTIAGLKDFNVDGYTFNADLSTDLAPVFTRAELG